LHAYSKIKVVVYSHGEDTTAYFNKMMPKMPIDPKGGAPTNPQGAAKVRTLRFADEVAFDPRPLRRADTAAPTKRPGLAPAADTVDAIPHNLADTSGAPALPRLPPATGDMGTSQMNPHKQFSSKTVAFPSTTLWPTEVNPGREKPAVAGAQKSLPSNAAVAQPGSMTGAPRLGAAIASGHLGQAIAAAMRQTPYTWTAVVPTEPLDQTTPAGRPWSHYFWPQTYFNGQKSVEAAPVKANKVRSSLQVLNSHGILTDLVLSTLQSAGGSIYTMSNTRKKGAFGAIGHGIDAAGNWLAIKTVRLKTKTDANQKPLRAKTAITDEQELQNEFNILRLLGRPCDLIRGKDKAHLVLPYKHGDAKIFSKRLLTEPLHPLQRTYLTLRLLHAWAEGLAEVHSRGIAHLDSKMQNYLYDGEGRMEAADFGLSRVIDPKTGSVDYNNGGTREYMSPEALAARAGDARTVTLATDIWALGMMALEAHSGKVSPLNRARNDKEVRTLLDDLAAWRRELIAFSGPQAVGGPHLIDVGLIDARDNYWADYVSTPHPPAAALTSLVLGDLLNPDVATRCNAKTLLQRSAACISQIRSQAAVAPEVQTMLLAADARWGSCAQLDPGEEEVFEAIAAYHQSASKLI
jgi:serine/threonine protein kinase